MFGIPDIQFFIKDKTGRVRPLVKGDYIKKDGELDRIYKMENPSYGITGEEEILGQWSQLQENGEVNHYGHLEFKLWTSCNYKGNDKHYLFDDHTLVSQKELVKFGLTSNSVDFIVGD